MLLLYYIIQMSCSKPLLTHRILQFRLSIKPYIVLHKLCDLIYKVSAIPFRIYLYCVILMLSFR